MNPSAQMTAMKARYSPVHSRSDRDKNFIPTKNVATQNPIYAHATGFINSPLTRQYQTLLPLVYLRRDVKWGQIFGFTNNPRFFQTPHKPSSVFRVAVKSFHDKVFTLDKSLFNPGIRQSLSHYYFVKLFPEVCFHFLFSPIPRNHPKEPGKERPLRCKSFSSLLTSAYVAGFKIFRTSRLLVIALRQWWHLFRGALVLVLSQVCRYKVSTLAVQSYVGQLDDSGRQSTFRTQVGTPKVSEHPTRPACLRHCFTTNELPASRWPKLARWSTGIKKAHDLFMVNLLRNHQGRELKVAVLGRVILCSANNIPLGMIS